MIYICLVKLTYRYHAFILLTLCPHAKIQTKHYFLIYDHLIWGSVRHFFSHSIFHLGFRAVKRTRSCVTIFKLVVVYSFSHSIGINQRLNLMDFYSHRHLRQGGISNKVVSWIQAISKRGRLPHKFYRPYSFEYLLSHDLSPAPITWPHEFHVSTW